MKVKKKDATLSHKDEVKIQHVLETEEFPQRLGGQLPKGGHIVRWAAILDILESDGTRALYSVTSDGMTEWEWDGMVSGNAPYPFPERMGAE